MLSVEAPDSSAPIIAEGTKWVIPLLLVVTGLFMAILDVTIVNVAVPAIQYSFGGTLDDVLWIATAYTLTLGVVVPLSSWLGDRIGLSRLFIVSLVGFALGSGLCGLAWNLDTLVAFRILQAIPGGILPVASLTMIYRLVPAQHIGIGMGVYGLGGVAAPAVGPVLGGYLVEYIDWRLIFYINVPIGLLTALASAFAIPRMPKVRVHRFDFAGFAAIAIAMFAILLAASEGEHWGWAGYRIRILFVVGALFLALFVVIELQVEYPLLELRLFANRQFAFATGCMSVFFLNILVGVFYIPVFLQQGQGMQAFDAGLVMLPSALVMCVTIPLSGWLYERMGPRVLGIFGMLYLVAGNYLMASVTPDMTHADVILWTCIRGLGMGIGVIPVMTCGISSAPADKTNHASAINNVSQQIGGALGLAALGTMITAQQAQLISDRTSVIQHDSAVAHLAGPLLDQTAQMSASIFAIAYRLGMMLQLRTMSTAFGNMFVVVAIVTAALIPLMLTMRHVVTPTAPMDSDCADSHDEPDVATGNRPFDPPQPPPAPGEPADGPAVMPIGRS